MVINKNKIYWLGISGVALFVTATILGGLQFADYSHIQQYISVTYAKGTPFGVYLRLFGFIPSGILMALFFFLSLSVFPKSRLKKNTFIAIGVFYGLGTVLTSIFPCDEGCDIEFINPSTSQIIHNVSGFLTYIIVPACMIIISFIVKKWTHKKGLSLFILAIGIMAIFFVGLLTTNPTGLHVGLYQRIIEGSILFFIMILSILVKNYKPE